MIGIISFGITLIELVIMVLFGYICKAFWDQLCGCLVVISWLVSEV